MKDEDEDEEEEDEEDDDDDDTDMDAEPRLPEKRWTFALQMRAFLLALARLYFGTIRSYHLHACYGDMINYACSQASNRWLRISKHGVLLGASGHAAIGQSTLPNP